MKKLVLPIAFVATALAAAPALGAADAVDPLAPAAGDFLDADVGPLADAAAKAYDAGDYAAAAAAYLEYLRYNVTDSRAIYNLACCYGLLGEADLAAKYLDRAVRAGFADAAWLREDPDFAKVRGTPAFDAAVARVAAAAAEAEKAKASVFLPAAALARVRVVLPAEFDAGEKYDLVVGLHGRGADAASFALLWERLGGAPFIYAVPEAPYEIEEGGARGFCWTLEGAGDASEAQSRELTVAYVAAVVKDLKKRYHVSRVYLLGFSQGASVAYLAGVKHAGLVDGIVCFGGWFQPAWFSDGDWEKAASLRVFISHGRADTVIPFAEGEKARDLFFARGVDVCFLESDGGHAVPVEHLKLVLDWMAAP